MEGFDLGNESASSRERLQSVQQWVLRDDLAHHTEGLTQALMGQWPAGLKEVVMQNTLLQLLKALGKAGHVSQQMGDVLHGVGAGSLVGYLGWTGRGQWAAVATAKRPGAGSGQWEASRTGVAAQAGGPLECACGLGI